MPTHLRIISPGVTERVALPEALPRRAAPRPVGSMRVAALVLVAAFAAIGGAAGMWALADRFDGRAPSADVEGPRTADTFSSATTIDAGDLLGRCSAEGNRPAIIDMPQLSRPFVECWDPRADKRAWAEWVR